MNDIWPWLIKRPDGATWGEIYSQFGDQVNLEACRSFGNYGPGAKLKVLRQVVRCQSKPHRRNNAFRIDKKQQRVFARSDYRPRSEKSGLGRTVWHRFVEALPATTQELQVLYPDTKQGRHALNTMLSRRQKRGCIACHDGRWHLTSEE